MTSYADFRSLPAENVPFYTPKQLITTGIALKNEAEPSSSENVPSIFKPLKIREHTFSHRLFMAPMCMYSTKDGLWTDFHVAHYGQYALRGVSLIILEATAVEEKVCVSRFRQIQGLILNRDSIRLRIADYGRMTRFPD